MYRPVARLAISLFAIQSGFHAFTATIPLALAHAGATNSEIGLIVGAAAITQLPVAAASGSLLDRFGGFWLLVAAACTYLLATALLAISSAETGVVDVPLVTARIAQGFGFALALPAALSMVPQLIRETRHGLAIGFVGSSPTLSMVFVVPVSVATLSSTSLQAVSLGAGLIVLVGIAFALTLRREEGISATATARIGTTKPVTRFLGLAVDRLWAWPLVIAFLNGIQWGVVTAYLPQHAAAFTANASVFFVGDGLAIILLRTPVGWVIDRMDPQRLIMLGLASTGLSSAILLLPATTPLLALAGGLSGVGAAAIVSPIVLLLSRRSTGSTRGSALGLYSAAIAGSLAVGAIGTAPFIGVMHFEGALLMSIVAAVLAFALAARRVLYAGNQDLDSRRPH